MTKEPSLNAIELTAELTIAWLSNQNNRVSVGDVPTLLRMVHAAVTDLVSGTSGTDMTREAGASDEDFIPAVTVRKSLASKDYIISLIDGKPYKMLRRHLSTHGLSPEEYRRRYNLKADYPIVAENYSIARREMAKKIGLGRKPEQKPAPRKRTKSR